MKELLKQYAAYNIWANQKLIDTINGLSEETVRKEVPSSFGSLFKSVLHMLDAEKIWWQRMKLQERLLIPSEDFSGNFQQLSTELLQQCKQWQE